MQDRTGRGLRSRPVRRRSQLKWPAGNPTLPATLLEDSWLVTSAPSAPLSTAKVRGTALWAVRCWRCGCRPAGPLRGQPGATHLGATVMRIRGYIVPSEVFDVTGGAGVCGIRSIRGTRTSPTSTTSPSCSPTTTGWPGSRGTWVPPDLLSLAPTSPGTSTPLSGRWTSSPTVSLRS